MNNPKISIIVPVYNAKAYLEKCILSIMEQSYQRLEILLVDDGSTDGSSEMCDAIAIRDSRVKVIHQSNGGPSKARNTGIDAASGEYILFVDSDDYIDKDMCLKLLENHDNYGMVICGVIREGKESSVFPREPKDEQISSSELLEKLLYGKEVKSWPVNKLIAKELLNGIRFNDEMKYEEDVEFFIRLCSTHNFSVKFIPDYLYHYVIRDNSLTSALQNRMSSYETINLLLNKLSDSAGKIYRRTTIYINECRVMALTKHNDNSIINRNRQFLRTQYQIFKKDLDKAQLRRCRLIITNYRVYELFERMNLRLKQGRG